MSSDRYSWANKEGTYFLTFTVVDWIDVFTRKEHAYLICDSLNHNIAHKGLVVHAWVIMRADNCRTHAPYSARCRGARHQCDHP